MTVERDDVVASEVDSGLETQLRLITEQMAQQQAEMARLQSRVVALTTAAGQSTVVDAGGDDGGQADGGQVSSLAGPSSRRNLLRTGAAAVGAGVVAVGLGSKPAAAADGDSIIIGATDNEAQSSTLLFGDLPGIELIVLSNLGATGSAMSAIASDPTDGVIRATNGSTTGSGAGLRGKASSPDGRGVNGEVDATTGTPHGVRGFNESAPAGSGVYGRNAAPTGAARAVRGDSINSPTGVGVQGFAASASGATIGVQGVASSPEGAGGLFSSPGAAVAAKGRVSVVPSSSAALRAPQAPIHVKQDGSADPVELLLQLESDVPPQQTFVNNTTDTTWFFAMTSDDQFKISRDGTGKVEAKFFDNGNLQIAGTLIQASDVAVKHDIETVDEQDVLARLAEMPVFTWKYDNDPTATHIGPTSQDFAAAFGFGNTETGIASVDADGVALTAIKALHQQNLDLQTQLQHQTSEINELKKLIIDQG